MKCKIQFIFIVKLCVFQAVSSIFFESVYQLYKESRIPFREDPYIGNRPILKEYDFIVIGSGPGGATAANRLSEIYDWKVLILEAGKDGSIYTDIPAIVSYLQFTDYNWGYKMEKIQNLCLAMKDQRCPWPRGKGVGGSSLLNYMIYTRGHPADFDNYEKSGNTGWAYKDILPYYLKSEKINIPDLMNSSYHSKNGYLDVEQVPYKTKLVDVFLDGCEELGYKPIDYNSGEEHEGASRIQVTMRSGKRVSAAKAYLESIQHRPNLHVVEKARVTKIMIDPKTKRAIGVEFVKNRKRRSVFAKKEVVLSAGSLNSPHLLMLSGIGPKNHLELHKIPVVKDLPVGENLQEHFTMPGMVFTINVSESITENKALNLENLDLWLSEGKGILTLPGGVEGLTYVSSKYNQIKDLPDLELLFIAGSVASDGGHIVKDSFGISEEFYNNVYRSIDYAETMTVFPILLRPKSRGRVILQDKNPWHWPLFYLDYFNNTSDLDVMVDGIKKVVQLGLTDAFKSVGARLHSVPFPGCSRHSFGSDEYWACATRTLLLTLHHQSGTCKMGPASDPTAVVDPRLRVHGIQGLRVVDASIFPEIPTAHLYAPTVMVGEKAADMIKADWKRSC
ncbi:glucose dehydrogenase [FAD, quinone]-like [Macrosteles quadrilineatus]|uniref:glucose dehydrogenase [FAD, quinone]-like n=1 Tax=Macrosteles quadrilineatus TaxID=74068 RepID=UPI0023E2AAAF|nr:glucose dehydrogenase [FAD, quinone]-like [Macrosteles quadrilineatus]XP_054261597.1 glucose dehydrogenase [FAD, quinone]-like [Macrosteles quadrilineatus]